MNDFNTNLLYKIVRKTSSEIEWFWKSRQINRKSLWYFTKKEGAYREWDWQTPSYSNIVGQAYQKTPSIIQSGRKPELQIQMMAPIKATITPAVAIPRRRLPDTPIKEVINPSGSRIIAHQKQPVIDEMNPIRPEISLQLRWLESSAHFSCGRSAEAGCSNRQPQFWQKEWPSSFGVLQFEQVIISRCSFLNSELFHQEWNGLLSAFRIR